jgi:hypothetical protein
MLLDYGRSSAPGRSGVRHRTAGVLSAITVFELMGLARMAERRPERYLRIPS